MNNTSFNLAFISLRPIRTLLAVVMSATTVVPLAAHDLFVNKLLARNAKAPKTASFGNDTAINDRWIVVGEPLNDDAALEAGAVHVYNTLTQTWVRKLTAPDAADLPEAAARRRSRPWDQRRLRRHGRNSHPGPTTSHAKMSGHIPSALP
jgi:hypothetical protein